MRKNVIAKCYGGDVTRKRKLLEKQKEGEKRMKRVARLTFLGRLFMNYLRCHDASLARLYKHMFFPEVE